MISVVQLGTVDYATGLGLQQQLVALRKEEKIGDVLLLLEHSPVITLGRNAKAGNVVASRDVLARRGVELFECDRGGDVTFHGPGQIVGYPIFDLRGFANASWQAPRRGGIRPPPGRGPDPHLRRLRHSHKASRRPDRRLDRSQPDCHPERRERFEESVLGVEATALQFTLEAKIAAIGVHISRFVTSHGFALNVNTDLSYFNLIIPCGITAKPVTSMKQELGKPLDLNAVAESISRNFGVVFQSQMLWVETTRCASRSCSGRAREGAHRISKVTPRRRNDLGVRIHSARTATSAPESSESLRNRPT